MENENIRSEKGKNIGVEKIMEGNVFRISTGSKEETAQVIIRLCEELNPGYFQGAQGKEILDSPIELLVDEKKELRPQGTFAISVHDDTTIIADCRNCRNEHDRMKELNEAVDRATAR